MDVMSFHATYKNMELNELERWTTLDQSFIENLLKECHVKEYVILRTCSRLEIYMYKGGDARAKFDALSKQLHSNNIFFLTGTDSISHLMRVCSGMDSMILGEQDVQRQVKEALQTAIQAGTSGKFLNYIFMKALSTGKEVREKTKIRNGITSIPHIAVKIIEEKSKLQCYKSVCVVGTGKMARSLLKYANGLPVNLYVCGRNQAVLAELAKESGATPIDIANLDITHFDCLLTAVSSPTPIITIRNRKRNPQIVIDLGNPRNVDSKPNTNYIDLDVLKAHANKTILAREKAIAEAENIIHNNLVLLSKKAQRLAAEGAGVWCKMSSLPRFQFKKHL